MNILRFLVPKSQVAYVESDSTVRQGLEKMRYHGYSVLPVLHPDGTYAGVVRDGDFLNLIIDTDFPELVDLEDIPLARLVHTANPPVRNSATMRELLERVMEHNFVPVTDDRGCFIGIIRRREIIRYFTERFLDEEE